MSDTPPRILRVLPGGVPQRDPWPSEREFFRARPDVSGLAADDGAVVLNPFCTLSPQQRRAVAFNEAARVLMSTARGLDPTFALTPQQQVAFEDYGPIDTMKATVAARILSADPSALEPTEEQLAFVDRLAQEMGFPDRFDAIREICCGDFAEWEVQIG